METTMNVFSKAMRAIASSMEIPVIILLLILIAVAVFLIGWLISEFVTEHKYLKRNRY